LKHVPDVREPIEEVHRLTVLKHSIARRAHYNRNKPLQRLVATVLSAAGIGLNKLGLKTIAQYLYEMSLYPKGTIGRRSE
jgi:hypothetical protein